MKLFFRGVDHPVRKRFYYRFLHYSKDIASAWYRRHNKILKHAGLGGKNHLLKKGHVRWNRKGRW